MNLSPHVERRLNQLSVETNQTTDELIHQLIDCYEWSEPSDVHLLQQQLRGRVIKGINGPFICELRLLYTYIGHLLTRIREL